MSWLNRLHKSKFDRIEIRSDDLSDLFENVKLGPKELKIGSVTTRSIALSDGKYWSNLRIKYQSLLEPWEPSMENWVRGHEEKMWSVLYSQLLIQVGVRKILPLTVEVDGVYAGQVTLGNIVRGSLQSAWLGYWISGDLVNNGVATNAAGLVLDYAFSKLFLHRVEATVHPKNYSSIKVLEKLGFRREGYLHSYMHVGGSWQDHYLYAITIDEYFARIGAP